MTTTTDTCSLLDVERRFWDAMQENDGTTAAEMTDDTCIVVGAQGVNAISPESMASMTREGKWQLQRYTLDDDSAQVRMIGEDVALVAYSVHEEVKMNGKPMSVDANDASVWVRRDGEWRCAMHVEAVAGDPFGRASSRQSKT
jgi:ketosteroid isomerase-like protein